MPSSFEEKVRAALARPQNLGEMPDADATGTAGSAGCGDLLRVWIRFREQSGRRVIDRASFQTFGCETAIAMASMATEMIRGKTVEEAMAMRGEDFAADLGPIPPMKVHCGALVEAAFRDALSQGSTATSEATQSHSQPAPGLADCFKPADQPRSGRRLVILPQGESARSA
jgi:NifU-like protein involved in Fe-S cluster formation